MKKKVGAPIWTLRNSECPVKQDWSVFSWVVLFFLMIECKGKPADEYRQLSNLRPSWATPAESQHQHNTTWMFFHREPSGTPSNRKWACRRISVSLLLKSLWGVSIPQREDIMIIKDVLRLRAAPVSTTWSPFSLENCFNPPITRRGAYVIGVWYRKRKWLKVRSFDEKFVQ